jgi:hypothetical protein
VDDIYRPLGEVIQAQGCVSGFCVAALCGGETTVHVTAECRSYVPSLSSVFVSRGSHDSGSADVGRPVPMGRCVPTLNAQHRSP